MPLRIDIHRDYAVRAFEAAIASLKRSAGKGHNQAINELIHKDISLYQNAINTLTELK